MSKEGLYRELTKLWDTWSWFPPARWVLDYLRDKVYPYEDNPR